MCEIYMYTPQASGTDKLFSISHITPTQDKISNMDGAKYVGFIIDKVTFKPLI